MYNVQMRFHKVAHLIFQKTSICYKLLNTKQSNNKFCFFKTNIRSNSGTKR